MNVNNVQDVRGNYNHAQICDKPDVEKKAFDAFPIYSYPVVENRFALSHPTQSSPNFVPLGKRIISIIYNVFRWFVDNRFGLAKLVGLAMVPSQFECVSPSQVAQSYYDENKHAHIKKITIHHNGITLLALIVYPENGDVVDKRRCILFNNPNCRCSNFFIGDREVFYDNAAGFLQKKMNCPVIFYDYRGTGMNKSSGFLGKLPMATHKTIIQDGVAALNYALDNFEHVELLGSSLGGGVATISLAEVMKQRGNEDLSGRVELTSHDSFSTTPRIVFPNSPRFADALGTICGGNLNAEKSMTKLIDRGIKVKVVNSLYDQIIPTEARMSEYAKKFSDRPHVKVIEVENDWHCHLSEDIKSALVE